MVTLIYKTSDNVLDSLSLDATVSESHSRDAEITDHPVEVGADVSDHVRQKPAALRLEGIVTDYPLPGQKPSFGAPALPAVGRSTEIYALLERLQGDATLIEVRTSLKRYENMVIQGLNAPREKNTKGAVRFTCNLREIRLVDSQVVPLQVTKVRKAQPKTKGGKQTPTEAEEAEKRKSILLKVIDNSSDAYKKFSSAF